MRPLRNRLQSTETESTAIVTEIVPEIVVPAVTEPTSPAIANPMPKFDPKPDSGLLMRIQTHLKLLGFDPGPIDGIMGRKTYDAIRQFQQAERHEGGRQTHGNPAGRFDFVQVFVTRFPQLAPAAASGQMGGRSGRPQFRFHVSVPTSGAGP